MGCTACAPAQSVPAPRLDLILCLDVNSPELAVILYWDILILTNPCSAAPNPPR